MNFQKQLPIKVLIVTTYTLVEKQAQSHEANVPVSKTALTYDTAHRNTSK